MRKADLEQIEHEVVMLLRRADFKRTLDGEPSGLERSAYLLLKKLREEGPIAIGAVAEAFRLDVSTVSRQVAALEARGYVSRQIDPKDARISRIEMTDSGAEAFERAYLRRLASYEELLSDWTDENMRQFAELLARFNLAIDERKQAIIEDKEK